MYHHHSFCRKERARIPKKQQNTCLSVGKTNGEKKAVWFIGELVHTKKRGLYDMIYICQHHSSTIVASLLSVRELCRLSKRDLAATFRDTKTSTGKWRLGGGGSRTAVVLLGTRKRRCNQSRGQHLRVGKDG